MQVIKNLYNLLRNSIKLTKKKSHGTWWDIKGAESCGMDGFGNGGDDKKV